MCTFLYTDSTLDFIAGKGKRTRRGKGEERYPKRARLSLKLERAR